LPGVNVMAQEKCHADRREKRRRHRVWRGEPRTWLRTPRTGSRGCFYQGAILPEALSVWYFFFYRQNGIFALTGEPPAEETKPESGTVEEV
jgi:hypothetical protein